jgi:hypothetical protein
MQRQTTSLMSGATLALASLTLLVPAAIAQQLVHGDAWCDRRDHHGDRGWHCEVREFTLASRDEVSIDARPNGGITVEGADRSDILVRARVVARADTDTEAREMVSRIDLAMGGTIEADGPRPGRDESWSVSYWVFVPRRSNLHLQSTNGGIHVADVSGDIDFRTTNGGIDLQGLSGDVRGQTTNGGLDVELAGSEWQGDQLDVRTTNGGVRLLIPEGYNARLEVGTTNGGLRFDFPVTVQGRLDRHLTLDLGAGGRLIRARTTNGGVVVRRR